MNEVLSKIAGVASAGITCIKNADNPYFNSKYADLGTVVEALKEPLKVAGLTYMFRLQGATYNDGATNLWDVNMYVSDGKATELIASFPLVNMADAQKIGQGITYAKRYLLTTVFNVIAEADDDGNEVSGKTTTPSLPKRKPTMMPGAMPKLN